MVYTALQLISRARAPGLSVVDLGKKTGYDQKACWYVVQQLLELDLVVKLRRAGVGANFCVHKHFYERETMWTDIRDEAAAGVGAAGGEEEGEEEKHSPFDLRHSESP